MSEYIIRRGLRGFGAAEINAGAINTAQTVKPLSQMVWNIGGQIPAPQQQSYENDIQPPPLLEEMMWQSGGTVPTEEIIRIGGGGGGGGDMPGLNVQIPNLQREGMIDLGPAGDMPNTGGGRDGGGGGDVPGGGSMSPSQFASMCQTQGGMMQGDGSCMGPAGDRWILVNGVPQQDTSGYYPGSQDWQYLPGGPSYPGYTPAGAGGSSGMFLLLGAAALVLLAMAR